MPMRSDTNNGCFRDRAEAGQLLAGRLTLYINRPDVLVLALPRGGVPVAFEIAQALHAPLDILVVRKLGVPDQVELAMGAIASWGIRVLNHDVVAELGIPKDVIEHVTITEQAELKRRERVYRGNLPSPVMRGRTIILVDDGLATGATMRAAIMAVRTQQPAKLVVAVPVAATESIVELRSLVDDLVCVIATESLHAIGYWYEDFTPTTDAQVCTLLKRAAYADGGL